MTTENDDAQAVVLEVPEAISSTLDQLHLAMEAFGDTVAVREDEHSKDLLLPGVKRFSERPEEIEAGVL